MGYILLISLKDTPRLREWIFTKVARYSAQIGIPEPYVIFNWKDMERGGFEPNTYDKRLISHKAGNAWIYKNQEKPNILSINIKHHDDKEELENTIAHELLHIRFPIMNHGEDFYTRLGMVLMGKKYGKVKPKK